MKICNCCKTPKPVSEFGKNKRYEDGLQLRCKACCRADNLKYSKAHRAEAVERAKAWAAANPERAKARSAADYYAKREDYLARRKARDVAHPEHVAKSNAKRYRKNREDRLAKSAAYKLVNADRVATWNRNRHAKKRNAGGKHTVKELRVMLEAQNYLCANPRCLADLRVTAKQVDHVHPISRGGRNDIGNLQWLCAPCNYSKRAKTMSEWVGNDGYGKASDSSRRASRSLLNEGQSP